MVEKLEKLNNHSLASSFTVNIPFRKIQIGGARERNLSLRDCHNTIKIDIF